MGSRHLRTLLDVGLIGGLTDRQLLEQFSTGHREIAEAAFTTLVERHGPMAMRVCRGILGDSLNLHDSFQATFLVLVRKADSLRVPDSLGPWLHAVAFRVATKAKVAAARRKVHEILARSRRLRPAKTPTPASPRSASSTQEAHRLPPIGAHRSLSGGPDPRRSRDSAGLAGGTVSGRLARVREMLRSRMVRCGACPVSRGDRWAGLGKRGECDDALAGVGDQCRFAGDRAVGRSSAGGSRRSGESVFENDDLEQTEDRIGSSPCWDGCVRLGPLLLPTLVGDRDDGQSPTQPIVGAAAEADVDSWPPGVTVSGRVLDHRGEPVPAANVLLLGSEQLTVLGRSGPGSGAGSL